MLLAKAAADVLRQLDSPSGHIAVAVVALSEATRQRLDVPLDAPVLLWRAVERSPSASWASTATEAIGIMANRSLVSKIVQTITHGGASAELRRMAFDALAEPRAAAHVTDAELLGLVEVARGRATSLVANVILAVSEGRTIPAAVVTSIAERWSLQPDPHQRIAALELVELLPPANAAALIERLVLHDPSPIVRELTAMRISDVFEERADALALIDGALAMEEHPGVVAELMRAKAHALAKTE